MPGPEPTAGDTPRLPRSRWSWDVGSIAGIPIRIHVSLLFLLAWIALAYWIHGVGPTTTIAGVVLVVAVFATVMLHELAHAIMARKVGVGARDILLLPIGGISSLERIPERPRDELAISLVGPAVNLVIATVLWCILRIAGSELELGAATSLAEALAIQLVWINVVLAVFNLLPAFPLDGGRVLRAILSIWFPRATATSVAAGLGKLFAFALGALGLFGNPWLILIAVVIWWGARTELEMTRLRTTLSGIPTRAAMLRRIDVVRADESLATAAAIVVNTGADVVPIVEHGTPIGVLTDRDIATGINTLGPDAPVSSVPHHESVTVAPDDPLERVLDLLQAGPGAVVVVDRDEPVGIVTPHQLMSYVALLMNRGQRRAAL